MQAFYKNSKISNLYWIDFGCIIAFSVFQNRSGLDWKPVYHTATPSEDESNCFYCLNGLFALFQIRTGLSSAKLFPLEELFYKHGKNEQENRLLSRRKKIKIVTWAS